MTEGRIHLDTFTRNIHTVHKYNSPRHFGTHDDDDGPCMLGIKTIVVIFPMMADDTTVSESAD